MINLLHDFITRAAELHAEAEALVFKDQRFSYEELERQVRETASGLVNAGLHRHDRVAVYLTKQVETVTGMFGAARAGGIFIPVNPVLKAPQVAHILTDSSARILITTKDRFSAIAPALSSCADLATVVLTDGNGAEPAPHSACRVISWRQLTGG